MKNLKGNILRSDWIRFSIKLVILIAILVITFGFLFGFQRIEGVAMSPHLNDGDLALFLRSVDTYNADDIIVYSHEDKEYSSRIIAVGGDLVTIDEDGYLFVNNDPVSSAPVYDISAIESLPISFPQRVPTGSYFLLNDNLDTEEDSRQFGAVLGADIDGRIITILRTRIE